MPACHAMTAYASLSYNMTLLQLQKGKESMSWTLSLAAGKQPLAIKA